MPPAQSSHLQPSEAASELARRLFAGRLQGIEGDDALVREAEHVCESVVNGLARSLGRYGAITLLGRALTRGQIEHPALRDITMNSDDPHCVQGLAGSVRLHGVRATTESVVAMLAVLTDVLARLIGDDLAVILIEQIAATSAERSAAVAFRMEAQAAASDDKTPVDDDPSDQGVEGHVEPKVEKP